MKKFLLMAVAVFMVAICVRAQSVRVIDTDGNAVPYASVMTPEADYIGITDLNGILADTKGATDIVVSHVAYKPKSVHLSGTDEPVVLEDADFGLSEITVTSKPLVYVQTYYRMYLYHSNDDGIVYYRVGLTDNVYDREKQKVSSSTNHKAKASIGAVKFALGLFGSLLDSQGEIKTQKMEDRMMKWGKDIDMRFVDMELGKKAIVDFKDTIGSVVDDVNDGQRRYSYNSTAAYLHRLEAKGNEKKLAKQEKKEEKKKNRMEADFYVFQIDEDGNYGPEDFVMKQNLDSYDEVENDGETVHKIFAIQVFTTDRAYMTKDEVKQRKKENKLELTYDNILEFERLHNIPVLPSVVQQKLDELWRKGE